MEHYRCFKCFVPTTAKEVVTDTVRFLPKKVPFPELNLNIYLKLAIEKIIKLLETNQYPHIQSNQYEILKSFKNVAQTLQQKETKIPLPPQPRVQSYLHELLQSIKNCSFLTTSNIRQHFQGWLRHYPQIPTHHSNYQYKVISNNHRYNSFQGHIYTAVNPPQDAIDNQYNTLQYHIPQSKLSSAKNKKNPKVSPPTTNPIVSSLQADHIFDKQGKKISLDTFITNNDTKDIWKKALNNELGRLSSGFQPNNVKGTQTIRFIQKKHIPNGRKITYSNFVCDLRPLKKEIHRVRMTVGGDRLEYFEDTASPAATLLDTKLILNSTISDHKQHGAQFCSIERYFSTEFL